MEDKEGFVRALSAALAEFGGGGEEFVRIDDARVCVTGDSLRALMRDVASSDRL